MKFLFLTFVLFTPLFAESFPAILTVDASKPIGELKPTWRLFGADEPNYVTMRDGRKLLPETMSTHPQPYRYHWTPAAKYGEIFTGLAYPPKDYAR